MEYILITFFALIAALLINFFYWKPKYKKLGVKYFNSRKDVYQAIDVNIKLKKELQSEQSWLAFLNGEG